MAHYKLATYATKDGPRAGLIVDDFVFDAAKMTGNKAYGSVLAILEDWRKAKGALKTAADKAAKSRQKTLPLKRAKLLAPIIYPTAIYCAGANYTDHVKEMNRVHNRPDEPDPHTLGLKPWHFLKASRTVANPGATVKISTYSKAMDWEVELTAVIGTPARNVPIEKALSHVAGYTCAIDLSARDLGFREKVSPTSPFRADWVAHKSFQDSCPLGPWITPASDIKNPQDLDLKLWVNDVIKQDSNTSEMIFNLAEQISHLSSSITLYPGDIILTGTPSGVGAARKEFLKAGDTVKVWIEDIGELTAKMA